jgi:hypothetical protein
MSPLETYLTAIRDIHSSGEGVNETSYYSALDSILNEVGKSLKPKVRCVLQLRNRGVGSPDGGLFTEDQLRKRGPDDSDIPQNPARGVIEAKPIADDAWVTATGPQVSRYWGKYRLVLVTNYRDFVIVGQDPEGKSVRLESYHLAPSAASFWKAVAHPRKTADAQNIRFVEFIKRALLHAAQLVSPKDVAFFLASYARDALARIEHAELDAVAGVRTALEEGLGLKFADEKGEHFFRSSLVQTLFYGVFSAWVLWARRVPPQSKERFEWGLAARSLSVPVIRKLFHELTEPGQLKQLRLDEALEWTAAVLNRVDRKQFFERFEQSLAVQYFYEPFLEAFDPQLRKQLGVWYTPPEIVEYMVARVDRVLREELGVADGLADRNVYVLDPCCGTGSFLVEVLRTIHATLSRRGDDALLASDLREAACQRIFGFEILPAPFVVSHMQLGLLLDNFGAPLSGNGATSRAAVYLTNALTGWVPPKAPKNRLLFRELEQERDAAEKVKREAPILVVLGNPPYNAFAGVSPEEENGLLEPYKRGLEAWGITKNYLDDLYVRFFRIAEHRIAEMGERRGIVSYISSFSYLGDPSFVVMRERFLSAFDKLWFDCMNGDSRETGKVTPDGKPDPSVFSTERNREGIRVGTAVSLMVRKSKRSSAPWVGFRHFWGTAKRADLLATRDAEDFDAAYKKAHPDPSNRFSFLPSRISSAYASWPSITMLAAEKPMLGLNENRAGSLQDIDRDRLEHRLKTYLDPAIEWDQLKALETGLTDNAAGFDPRKVRDKVLRNEAYDSTKICRYIRRPFDLVWAYVSDVSPLWNRSRPKLRQALSAGGYALLTRPSRAASPEGPPILTSQLLGEQDLMRGHAYYFPLVLPTNAIYKKASHPAQGGLLESLGTAVGKARPNLSVNAADYLNRLDIEKGASLEAAGHLWAHALAIGCSPMYSSENADGLRQDWPRIPLPNSKRLLGASEGLGRKLIELLDAEAPVRSVTHGDVRPELKLMAVPTRVGSGTFRAEDFRVDAGWGHGGKEGVTMPGKGRLIERDYTKAETEAVREGARAGGMSLEAALQCLGEKTCDVYLNGEAYWANVPINVWDYFIGGFQVIKKWLSYRETKLLGRLLTKDEVRYVQEMVRRIATIRLLEPALDSNYHHVKDHCYDWPVGASAPAAPHLRA